MNDFKRSVLITLLVALLVAMLSGCGSSGTSSIATKPEALDEPDEAADSSPESSSLAELAQRDVDAFLNQRRESSASEESGATPPPARRIVWNQNPDAEPSPAPSAADASADEKVAQSPLFLVAEEPASLEPAEADDAESVDRNRVRELIVELSKELYVDAAHADMPLRELFLIAATTLVSPDRAINADAIPGLTARERDMLREFQRFFVSLGTELDGGSDAEETIIGSLDQLRNSLRAEPQLTLGTVALCTRVGGFGDFDEFDKYAFLAHHEQQAVVYIEIIGFTSELNQRDEWVTELSQQLTIYSDRDGIPVWSEDWQTAADRSRNKRTDFFVVQLITLPKALSVGRYHLKLRVRDEKSKAEAEATVTFEMVADPKMAAGGR